MEENKESCQMFLVAGEVELLASDPGAFYWEVDGGQRTLWCKLPNGDVIHLYVRSHRSPSWGWDGDEEKPTLDPSVKAVGRWHGHFTKGEMRSCA